MYINITIILNTLPLDVHTMCNQLFISGQRFAYMSARTAASQLFLKYKVQPIPGSPKPKDVKIESKGLFLGPGEPVHVEFIPRTENGHD